MTQEQEELLLKDLCARLPYGVILNCCEIVSEPLTLISYKGLVNNDYDIDEVKPYLFPLESMTEEQRKEYEDALVYHNYVTQSFCLIDKLVFMSVFIFCPRRQKTNQKNAA